MKTMTLDRWQGETKQGKDFGYVSIGEGGYFVTWHETLEKTLDSIKEDSVDAPPDLTNREHAHMRQMVREEWRRRQGRGAGVGCMD